MVYFWNREDVIERTPSRLEFTSRLVETRHDIKAVVRCANEMVEAWLEEE